MSDIEQLKAEVKRLNAQATSLKMDLHDLSEELPRDWERIPDIAGRAFAAYRDLAAARQALAAAS